MCKSSLPGVADQVGAPDDFVSGTLTRFLDFYKTDLNGRFLLAVSGGGDSLALLHAMADAFEGQPDRLIATTVDHSLRPAAADEARFVGEVCHRLGIQHEILKLDWQGKERVSQADARRARYAALCQLAHSSKAQFIATGHTLDDQLETVGLRLRAGSGVYGLSGMADIAPVPVWPEGQGVQIIRPLLARARSDLRGYLQGLGQVWIEDPSNENAAFERVRVRDMLAERPGLSDRFSQIVRAAGMARSKLSQRLIDWAGEAVQFQPGGAAEFSASAFLMRSEEERARLLSCLLTAVGGRETMPRTEKLEPIAGLSGLEAGRTLHGCFLRRDDDNVLVAAEAGAQAERDHVRADQEMIWRGRVKLRAMAGNLAGVSLTEWGEKQVPERLQGAGLPAFAIRRSLPVVMGDDGNIAAVPHLEKSGTIYAIDLAEDLAEPRFYDLLRHKAQFFDKEYRIRESFS